MAHVTEKHCPQCGVRTRHTNGVCNNPHPAREEGLFHGRNEAEDLVTLIDCAYDIMELWKAEGPYNIRLRAAWLKRARELGAQPSP